jgi:hypothetical protein
MEAPVREREEKRMCVLTCFTFPIEGMVCCFTCFTFVHVPHIRKGDVLASKNKNNAEFGGPGQRTRGREDVCVHAFHVSHGRVTLRRQKARQTQTHASKSSLLRFMDFQITEAPTRSKKFFLVLTGSS